MADADNVIVVNEGVTGPEAPPDKAEPEKLWAGKFKSQEELEAAYLELQRKLGERVQDKPEESQDKGDAHNDEPRFIVAGKDFTKYAKVFAQYGRLDDAHYEELEKEGVPREVVDAYIAGVTSSKGAAKEVVDAIKASVGGEESFQRLANWARENLPKEEIIAYNKAIDTGDPDIMRMAVERLKARYDAVYGKAPKLVAGTPTNPSGDVFRSTAEVVAAMRDPRYSKDPAYRADVEAKLARSTVF